MIEDNYGIPCGLGEVEATEHLYYFAIFLGWPSKVTFPSAISSKGLSTDGVDMAASKEQNDVHFDGFDNVAVKLLSISQSLSIPMKAGVVYFIFFF